MTISMALRNTWPYKTCRWFSPLARAVTTYCMLIWSRNEFLVSMVSPAKPPITIDATGSVMCQK
jgi:hypothetical protein